MVAGCGGGAQAPELPVPSAGPAGGACGKDFGPSPFKRKGATQILVADFWAHRSAGPDFADSVTEQVDAEMRRFKEEALRNPKEFDIEVPKESLELGRLRCFVQGHEQAREAAEALGADVVVWGKAHCNAPGSAVNAQVQVDVKTDAITTGDGSPVSVGNVTVQGSKPYTVCPSATLVSSGADLRQTGRAMDLGSIGGLDLPALASTKPFMLVHFALGLHFFERGNPWLAARFFQKSASDVLATERNTESLDLMLGVAYHHLPDHERSKAHSRRALERVSGRGTAQEATLLNNIGSALLSQGEHAQALEHHRRALAILQTAPGAHDLNVAATLNNVGLALVEQGHYAQALDEFRRALAILKKVLGEEGAPVATLLNNIGGTLTAQGHYATALEHLRLALAIDENARGSEHPDVARDLNNIADTLNAQGHHAQALELLRRALAISEKALGKDHPDVATRLRNIGGMLLMQGEHAQALELFRRALAMTEKVLGKSHPTVAVDANNIGSALLRQGELAQALEQFRRALEIDKKALGGDHDRIAHHLNNIAGVLAEQGRYEEALEHLRRALEIDKKALGDDHPNVALRLTNIGVTLREQGRHAQAIEHLRRAVSTFEAALGPEHPSTIKARESLALGLAMQSGFESDKKKRGAKKARGVVVLRCGAGCQGVEAGDWLLAYNNALIEGSEQLLAMVKATPLDRGVTLTVVRNGKKQTLAARGWRPNLVLAE